MADTKPKYETQSGLKSWFAELLDPVSLDFIAYLPLEECAIRLESREKLGRWRSVETYVAITPVDAATYAFTIRRERKRHGSLEAHGYLQDREDGGTYVTGEVITASRVPIILFVFLGIVALVTFIFSLDHMLLFLAVLLTFGIIAEIVVQMHYRHELVEMIEMTLGY